MPGSITIRPIEANLTHNTELIGRMNPYCAFTVNGNVFKSQICKKGGKHPHWDDAVTIPIGIQNDITVEVMDKDKITHDDVVGGFIFDLSEVKKNGHASKWYPLTYKSKPAGEILMETTVSGDFTPVIAEEKVIIEQPAVIEQEIIREAAPIENRHVYTEQQQVVEPRTFLKEVDVVETRAHQETIEVMEPTKVLKEVQYTEAVPVVKQIEVTEPQVVKKEVEVIEPRLVTKTIQVVENVPVMKEVEVVENVTRIQEVETFEPQTFTKQVEVTDYVPVQKEVTVTEPVHLKKAVEYVEPVVTTKTITKEIIEPVIVDEKITTSVGPASVIAESEVYATEYFSRFGISHDEGLIRYNEWNRLRNEGYNDERLEEHFVTRGWGPIAQYNFGEFHGRYTPLTHSSHKMI